MQCQQNFDKMWAAETANDVFKAGLDDDQFVLVANSNKSCQVAVKTPWGSLTQRKTLEDIDSTEMFSSNGYFGQRNDGKHKL